MKAGELDRRITIQRPTFTRNALNEKEVTWVDYMVAWASKRDVSDRERFAAQQISATITTRFQLRWSFASAAIDPTYRLIFENRIYEIIACKELDRHDGIEITASARAEVPA